MKLTALVLIVAASPAYALVADGVTYSLTENSISGNTAFFTLTITGQNSATDTEGGRSGINAFALNQPAPGTVTAGTVTAPPNFNFVLGGLNSAGCDGSGNFFCFDNTTIPPTPGTALSTTPIVIDFNVTADTAGVWANYQNPGFKIDWVGSKNNYDLVSLPISVTHVEPPPPPPPPPPPQPVSEPSSLAMLGAALIGMGWLRQIYRRRNQAA